MADSQRTMAEEIIHFTGLVANHGTDKVKLRTAFDHLCFRMAWYAPQLADPACPVELKDGVGTLQKLRDELGNRLGALNPRRTGETRRS